MACIPAPVPPSPTLPSGITIAPPLPGGSFESAWCCKVFAVPLNPPPIPLGVALNPAIQAAITTALKGIQDYLDALPLSCPRE